MIQQYRFEAADPRGNLVRGVVAARDVPAAWDAVCLRHLRPLAVLEIPAVRPPRRRRGATTAALLLAGLAAWAGLRLAVGTLDDSVWVRAPRAAAAASAARGAGD